MSRRMRVLVTADAVGGVWTYALDLACGLSRVDVDTVIASMGPSPSAAQMAAARQAGAQLIDTGLPLDWLAESAAEVAEAGRRVASIAARLDVDLVQLNAPALAAEATFDMPLVAVVHSCVATWWQCVRGTRLPADFVWRTERVAAGLEAAAAVATPTAAFGELVRRCYALDRAPVTVLNGRTPLKLGQAAPHDFAFTAGRLWDDGKNLATLDAAAARIAIPIHAAGPTEGPNGTRVAFEHLHCLGSIDDAAIGRWLAARPVFVSAALYEPFGLAVLEAAAAGCPLVLSDIPTFREIWGDAAIYVPATDAEGFARAIADLAGDDFQRAVRGRAAKARAARYTPDAMAAQMARLYRSVLPAEPVPDPKQEARAAA
ncbi:glycosyltransferase family 4 protein [Sphingosinicella terrae]|uniref:glycosyltransferase family 4 protein n=1 Tax=Sphingosinicella terrae TaxID=2172047 RepID=UPI000E0CE8F6|nr:glycosyltransferase family 4 protein [Sphingosinicella terrae]